jgi:hypothetical protein
VIYLFGLGLISSALNLKHTFAGLYLQELQEERNTDRYSAFALDEAHTERRGWRCGAFRHV